MYDLTSEGNSSDSDKKVSFWSQSSLNKAQHLKILCTIAAELHYRQQPNLKTHMLHAHGYSSSTVTFPLGIVFFTGCPAQQCFLNSQPTSLGS